MAALWSGRFDTEPDADVLDRPPDPPSEVRVFFLANPNSPVGFLYPLSLVRDLARKIRGVFVVDEANVGFAPENAFSFVRQVENVIVTRTVSKSYSLAGVRLGYAIGRENLIRDMFKVKDPFNVNRLTQAVVSAAVCGKASSSHVNRPGPKAYSKYISLHAATWMTRQAIVVNGGGSGAGLS